MFTLTGFKNWKKVKDGKNCALLSYVGKDPNSPHKVAERSYRDLMNQSQHIQKVLDKFTSEEIANNRLRLTASIDTVRWLTFQGMMAIALPSSPVAGAASVVAGTLRAFGPHCHLSLNHSITIRSNFLLKLKTPTPSPHLFFPLNPLSPPYRYKCLAAMAGDENEEQGNEEDETEGEEDNEADENEHDEERRLYVGNLPYSMTQSQLTDVFQEAGRVDAVEVVYDRVTDRSRGFAFVTMGSAEEAKEAIRMFDGSQIGGRTAKVNFPEIPRGGEREVMAPRIRRSFQGFIDSPYKVYVGNLGWSLTSEALKEAFQDQPGLLSAKVIYERDSGRSRGFGFVSFASAEDVESALNAMNGVEVEGRPLRLNLASQRERTTVATSPESPQMQEAVIEPVSNAMQSSLGYSM